MRSVGKSDRPVPNCAKLRNLALSHRQAENLSDMGASKVFKPTDLPQSNSSGYPAPSRDGQRERWNRRRAPME
jgi:hypothetical protein